MQPDQTSPTPNEPTEPTVTESTDTTPTSPTASVPTADNKKLLLGVLAGIGVLLVILVVLIVLLLGKKDDSSSGDTANNAAGTSEQSKDDSADKKEVIKTVPTDKEHISFVLYAPRQTGSNTTINYGLKNTCAGCSNNEFVSSSVASVISKSDVYLLDENAGQKYNLIVDEDGEPLATPSCGGYVAPNQTKDCFAAFTKVPSGTTVSLVMNDLKIDGIKIR